MKIFENGEGWSRKVNFVDENNVLVGFDYYGQCCEDFGYFFTNQGIPIQKSETKFEFDPDSYVFDPMFFHAKEVTEEYDECVIATFKLINKNDSKDVVYLNLYNIHNGYYSHGFEISVGGSVINSGTL